MRKVLFATGHEDGGLDPAGDIAEERTAPLPAVSALRQRDFGCGSVIFTCFRRTLFPS